MTATPAGAVNIPGSLTVGGNAVDIRPWVSGRVTGAGAKITDDGRTGYTVSRVSAGRYTITMNTAHPNGTAFCVVPSVRGFFLATYGTPLNNSVNFDVYIYEFPNYHHQRS
jgi:hypothetical protein